jgi:transcriptional regulator with XRE-family HTH domain
MTTQEDTKRRIEAARILRDLSQRDMDEAGHADGLGRQELSRVERGRLPLTRVRRDALVRILRVPERWFLEEDVDDVVGLWEPFEQIAAITRTLSALAADSRLEELPGQAREALFELLDEYRQQLDREAYERERFTRETPMPSVAARAREAAQRLADTPPTSRRTPRASGDEGRGR